MKMAVTETSRESFIGAMDEKSPPVTIAPQAVTALKPVVVDIERRVAIVTIAPQAVTALKPIRMDLVGSLLVGYNCARIDSGIIPIAVRKP